MNKTKITQRFGAKLAAFIMIIVTAVITVVSVIAGTWALEDNFYFKDKEQVIEKYLRNLAISAGDDALYCYKNDVVEENGNFYYKVYNVKESYLGGTYGSAEGRGYYEYSFVYYFPQGHYPEFTGYEEPVSSHVGGKYYIVKCYIDKLFPIQDQFAFVGKGVGLLYDLRYGVWGIAVGAFVVTVLLFIFLLCSAGHRKGYEGIVENKLDKIPFDIYSAVMLILVCIPFGLLTELNSSYWMEVIIGGCCLLIMGVLIISYCMSVATRIKSGRIYKNTVCYKVCRWIWKVTKYAARGCMEIFRGFPLIWKLAVGMAIWYFVDFITCIMCFSHSMGFEPADTLVFGIIEKIILLPAIFIVALQLRKLQAAGERVAAGDISTKLETKGLFWDFKKHGENLNQISDGIGLAVEERMKSERMKTELITNVSHDIKTPLTSIINYVDLISKEDIKDAKLVEYVEVLDRQSHRLKKLIEDLVEASKAATGNLEVNLTPCEVGVLLTQTLGEYEQKLEDGNLQLITKQPENPVTIMADGRHLWRVFDNLMNNICKYAQPDTRVYLSVEEKNGRVQIAFKNISKYELDISSDELMERFVRGDESRNTEGNGLGLSIAKSLTELQNGTMTLSVDGDLFKVVLEFALMI